MPDHRTTLEAREQRGLIQDLVRQSVGILLALAILTGGVSLIVTLAAVERPHEASAPAASIEQPAL